MLVLHVLQQLDLLRDRALLALADAIHDNLAPRDLVPLLLVVALEDLLEGPMPQLGVELRTQKFWSQSCARFRQAWGARVGRAKQPRHARVVRRRDKARACEHAP